MTAPNAVNVKTGMKLTCEGSKLRVHQTFPSRGEVSVRWYDTGTFSTVSNDVLADCQWGWHR